LRLAVNTVPFGYNKTRNVLIT